MATSGTNAGEDTVYGTPVAHFITHYLDLMVEY
jgi:hypothetical protein